MSANLSRTTFDETEAQKMYDSLGKLNEGAVRMLMRRTQPSRTRTLTAWYGTHASVIAHREYKIIEARILKADRVSAKQSRTRRANM